MSQFKGTRQFRSRAALVAAALHEAGHAVAAFFVRIPVVRLDITKCVTRNPFFGANADQVQDVVARLSSDKLDKLRLKAERLALVRLAGAAAQRRHRPSSVRETHGIKDLAEAAALLKCFCSDEEELRTYVYLLQLRAKSLFEEPEAWKLVKAVAKRLAEQQTLSAEETARTIYETLLTETRARHAAHSRPKLSGSQSAQ